MMTLPDPMISALGTARRKLALLAVAGSALCPHLAATDALATDVTFKDFPYLIYCHSGGVDHAFYFSRLDGKGVAVYLTPDRQAGIITIDGAARRVGGDQSGTCLNKTIEDLRASGQAYDLPH